MWNVKLWDYNDQVDLCETVTTIYVLEAACEVWSANVRSGTQCLKWMWLFDEQLNVDNISSL